jgi:fibronectin type 3 domain-containing protein
LERLTNAVKTQTRYNDEPTILERLDNKSVQTSELQGSPDNKSDFIKAYRQENGNLNRMKIRFNQHTPKPFKTSITDNMARHRRQTHIGNL